MAISISQSVEALVLLTALYYVSVAIYRLFLSPISHLPGPRLAALTFWYEFYYDIYPYKHQYLWKIKELHEEYDNGEGPIIRINPIHVHINDPSFPDEIYAPIHRPRDRCGWFFSAPPSRTGPMSMSILQTVDHDLHRKRRQAVLPLFSKRSIAALENSVVRMKILQLCDRLSQDYQDGSPTNVSYAMSALTMDVISEYCFGYNRNSLAEKEYGKVYLDFLHIGVQRRAFMRQFPGLFRLMTFYMPRSVMKKINPYWKVLMEFRSMIQVTIEKILAEPVQDEKSAQVNGEHKTIFHHLRDAPNMPDSEKSVPRLHEEANVFLGAGTETTARTISVTLFYLVDNPDCLAKVREELYRGDVMPTASAQPSLATLEALPYLSAVVTEGVRMAHGVSSRMPRIATTEDMVYIDTSQSKEKKWIIPKGTPVMQSWYLHHTNPTIFPEPLTFRPERWIEDPNLQKHFIGFGRGSRNCVGMNLATSEIYLTLAHILRRFDLSPYDTIASRDVETTNDSFIGMTDLSSQGIRMTVTKDRLKGEK